MKKIFRNFKIGSLFGTDIHLHTTVLLLPLLIIQFSEPLNYILTDVAFVIILFACILVHEFGHILVAKKYGVKTPNVYLHGLGGTASPEEGSDFEKNPKEHFWIAIAGPITNFIMGSILIIAIFTYMEFNPDITKVLTVDNLKDYTVLYLMFMIMIMNFIMGIFNLVPVYPLDGGRILKSILDWKAVGELARLKSKLNVMRVSAIGSIGMFGFGIWISGYMMIVIAVLLFLHSLYDMKNTKNEIISIHSKNKINEYENTIVYP